MAPLLWLHVGKPKVGRSDVCRFGNPPVVRRLARHGFVPSPAEGGTVVALPALRRSGFPVPLTAKPTTPYLNKRCHHYTNGGICSGFPSQRNRSFLQYIYMPPKRKYTLKKQTLAQHTKKMSVFGRWHSDLGRGVETLAGKDATTVALGWHL